MFDFIIPQELNIADRIGKFTFAQLGFLASGFLVVMTMFITKSIPMWISLVVGIPVFLVCVVLAFFKKYDMPFYEYLMVLLVYKSQPQEMIYSSTNLEDDVDDLESEEELEEIVFA